MQAHKFESEILGITQASPRVKVFRLSVPENFGFTPGQFVITSINGLSNENGVAIQRSYSIASSPLEKGCIELCVALAENGEFTTKLHGLKEGDKVAVAGPYGVFRMGKEISNGTIFIAGGTGIAPIIAMLRTLYLEKQRQLHLFYGIRNEREFLYRQELEEYGRKGLKIVAAASDEDAEWPEKGFISDVLPKHVKSPDADVYICGPPLMVTATVDALRKLGFGDAHIRKEQW